MLPVTPAHAGTAPRGMSQCVFAVDASSARSVCSQRTAGGRLGSVLLGVRNIHVLQVGAETLMVFRTRSHSTLCRRSGDTVMLCSALVVYWYEVFLSSR
jgi:hypothetical protein